MPSSQQGSARPVRLGPWIRRFRPFQVPPYEVSRSTDVNFAVAVTTPIAFTDNFVLNTTGFVNLLPSTTYYFRIRARNGDAQFTTAFSQTGSTRTLDTPVPALSGTALGIS